MELKFRTLKANEIEVRVGSGNTLLLYKDARVDMSLLDEVVGVGNWQREHKILGNDIYCKVGIFNKELNCWVWVEDAGSSGNIEIEKTKASDSFKRACVNLGIGRELYTAPKIKLPDQFKNCQFFDVSEIEYNKNKEITKLVITTNFGKDVVFSYPRGANYSQTSEKAPKKDILADSTQGIADEFGVVEEKVSGDDLTFLQAYVGNLGGTEYSSFFTWLKGKYQVSKITDLTKEQGRKLAYYLKNRNK